MKKVIKIMLLSGTGLILALCFLSVLWLWLTKDEINQPLVRSLAKNKPSAELFQQFPGNRLTIEKASLQREGSGYSCWQLEFSSRYGGKLGRLNAQWWKQKNSSRLAIILPITGGGDPGAIVAWYLLRGHDFDILRLTREGQKSFLDSSALSSLKNLSDVYIEAANSVYAMQLRLANYALLVDWLKKEQHYQEIVLVGLSFGAIEGSILALHPDIKAAALVLGGGDIAEIIMASQEPFICRWRGVLRNKLTEFSAKALSAEEIQNRLVRIFEKVEPLNFVSASDPDKILMINGKYDKTIPLANSLKLWLASGQPQIILLPTTHLGSAWCLPYILFKIGQFFDQHLDHNSGAG